MWLIEPQELLAQLQEAGTQRFAQFVDDLIRIEALLGGLSSDKIHTQARQTDPDGGVDTRVEGAVLGDKSGFLKTPTCWQYKAQRAARITIPDLRKEINKPHVRRLVESGHAYLLCIADSVTDQKREKWEDVLGREAAIVDPNAPKPRVVAIDKIASWANRFPFIVMQFKRFDADLCDLKTWQVTQVKLTPQYVGVGEWGSVVERIRQHADFEKPVAEPCIVIQGEAGVGKTRVVFETLRSIQGLDALVGYTRDEAVAVQVVAHLIGVPEARGLLVADECSLRTRLGLAERLQGYSDRVRVIALDNSGQRPATASPTIWLNRIPDETVRKILEENYSQVPADWRSRFAQIAGGYVRFAADLCKHYEQGFLGGILGMMPRVEEYLQDRLGNDLRVLEALSLFPKVGFRGEVRQELESLSRATGIPVDCLLGGIERLSVGPGFIAVAGRYCYVTPAIVTNAASPRAWERWIAASVESFANHLAPPLMLGLLEQGRAVAREEVRSAIAAQFRDWVNEVCLSDLEDPQKTDLLTNLVEASPEQFLPVLRGLVETAPAGELRRIHNERLTGTVSARRSLVWLCERLAAFPEYFEDAEAILFKLACEESEPNLGNNASAIWRQFFRIQLSGTAVPFEQRICLLGERITQASNETLSLVFSAARGILESGGARMVGPAIVAGRIPPSDWAPQDRSEYRVCLEKTLDLIRREAGTASTDHRSLALRTLLDAIRPVLDSGLLDEARECVEAARLNNDERDRILEALDDYTYLHRRYGGDEKSTTRWKEYLAKVESWAESLRPEDLAGQVRALISRNEWDEGLRGEKGGLSPQVSNLAAEIKDNPRKLDHVLDWLNSDQALSAAVFGAALGEADQDGILIPRILGSLVVSGKPALGRGYVHGLARRHAHTLRDVNPYLDELEAKQPSAAFEIACAAGDSVDGANRAVRLADAGVVPVVSLSALAYRVGTREVQAEELQAILSRLVAASERGDSTAQSAALSILSLHIHMDKKDRPDRPLLDSRFKDLAWGLLEGGPPQRGGIDAHHWGMVLEWVAPAGPARAAKAATMTLLGNVYSVHDVATEFLSHWAGAFPDEVMDAFGEALMDPDKGYMIQIPIYGNLISQLPAESVIRWLQAQGVDGARRLARHLPPPRLDVLGNPVVPPVLEYVLREYEDDDEVFRAFVIGCHGTEVWVGDRSDKLRQEAAIARRFLSHPLRRVREWAKSESVSRERMADWEKQQFDEHWLP